MNVFLFSTSVRVLVIFSIVCLAGCSTFFGKHGVFRGRGADYLKSGSLKPIELPEGMASVPLEPMYAIPEVQSTDDFGDPVTLEDYKVPRPLPVGDKGEIGVKIQKLDDERWIYLNASTAQVWPRTQYFLNQGGLDVASSNAAAGIIETDWVGFKDDQEHAVRFRIQLAKGIHPETTEVHVLHQMAPRSYLESGNRPQWPEKSDDSEREDWLLRELANSLAKTVDNNSASLLGQNVGGELKAGFERYNSEPVLVLNMNTTRAWATVSHASDQGGFKKWQDDSDLGVMYVGYTTYVKSEKGFFSSLAFWSDEKPLPEKAPFKLPDLLSNLYDEPDCRALFADIPGAQFNRVNLKKGTGYLLAVNSQQGDKVHVMIRDYRGKRLSDDEAKRLLRILRENLI
ncbi:Beta-barrel assembly machine subunit BamC [Alteromonadaceae bacterium 2753L.S.0a.02]|nr:Beta-barrel assembly machine subunit BamC [Alteromonadaceae bacterium 2753L.S.0a.02]